MKKMMNLAVKLGIICVVAAAVLALTNSVTAPVIAQQAMDKLSASLKVVYAEADEYADITENNADLENITGVFEALQGGQRVGLVFQAVGPGGYSGNVEMLVGIDNDGNIVGFQVLGHAETPGIGSKIEGDEFRNSIVGKSASQPLGLSGSPGDGEILQISGATFSSTASLNGINAAIAAFPNVQ